MFKFCAKNNFSFAKLSIIAIAIFTDMMYLLLPSVLLISIIQVIITLTGIILFVCKPLLKKCNYMTWITYISVGILCFGNISFCEQSPLLFHIAIVFGIILSLIRFFIERKVEKPMHKKDFFTIVFVFGFLLISIHALLFAINLRFDNSVQEEKNVEISFISHEPSYAKALLPDLYTYVTVSSLDNNEIYYNVKMAYPKYKQYEKGDRISVFVKEGFLKQEYVFLYY